MNKSDLVAIRDALPSDKNFILATWLRGLYYGDTWYSEIPKQIFMEKYHSVIEFILSKPTVKIKIACLKDDADVILGYSVTDPDKETLHWVFVKKSWRHIGIANDLSTGIKTATHLTKSGLSILKKKELVFNPFNI